MSEAAAPAPRAGEEILKGLRSVAPVSVAFVPLGMALGVLVVQSGLAWWWAPIISGVIFAGSMEFLIVGLFAAAAPLAQIALSSLLVNFRHVFYALSFPLHQVKGLGWKAYSTFALTDEAYAVTATPDAQHWSRAHIITVQAFLQFVWVGSVVLGALAGTLIPPWIVGVDFAVTAIFVVLTIEAFRQRRSLPLPVLAFICAAVALLISREHMLVIAMSMFVAALIAGYFLRRRGATSREEGDHV